MATEVEKTAREIWDYLNPDEKTLPTQDELDKVELWVEKAETHILEAQKELATFKRLPPKIQPTQPPIPE